MDIKLLFYGFSSEAANVNISLWVILYVRDRTKAVPQIGYFLQV